MSAGRRGAVGGSCSGADKGEDRPAGRGVRRRAGNRTQSRDGQGRRRGGRVTVTGTHADIGSRLGKDVRTFVREGGGSCAQRRSAGHRTRTAGHGRTRRRLSPTRRDAAGRRTRGATGGWPAGVELHAGERRGWQSREPWATGFWHRTRERECWSRLAAVVAWRASRAGVGRGSQGQRRQGGGRRVQRPLASRLTLSRRRLPGRRRWSPVRRRLAGR